MTTKLTYDGLKEENNRLHKQLEEKEKEIDMTHSHNSQVEKIKKKISQSTYFRLFFEAVKLKEENDRLHKQLEEKEIEIDMIHSDIAERDEISLVVETYLLDTDCRDDRLKAYYRQGKIIDRNWVNDEDSDDEEPGDICVLHPTEERYKTEEEIESELAKLKERNLFVLRDRSFGN